MGTQLLNLKNLKNYQPTNSEMADVYNAIENITKKKKQSSRKHSACHNRECNNPQGYKNKPNSIYCSSRCQSREQNLRQGRVKNIRKPNFAGKSDLHSRESRTKKTNTSIKQYCKIKEFMFIPPC